MKKKVVSIILVVSFLMMVLAGCTGSSTDVSSSSKGDDKVIKIGQVVHMTGNAVESGGYEKNGADLAVEEINAAGGVNGYKIELVQEDGKSTNPGVVSAFQKLIEDKEMVAVIGPSPSVQVAAMLPTINEAEIPVFTGGTNVSLTDSGCEWLFRMRPHDGYSAKAMVQFTIEDLKAKKIAIVHSTDSFGTAGAERVVAELKESGISPVLIQGYNNDEKDFTGVISNIKQSGADAMVAYFTLSPDLGIFAKQRKQQGLDIDWVSSPSIFAVAGRELAGDALYGTYGVADFHPEATEEAKEYTSRYREKFGVEPDFYSAWTYDSVYVFAEVIKNIPEITPAAIRDGIFKIQNFKGAIGTYNFDEKGDGLKHYHIVVNDSDTLKVVKTIEGE
jgi:branched-chain amino acid transport system substrate-binding protein